MLLPLRLDEDDFLNEGMDVMLFPVAIPSTSSFRGQVFIYGAERIASLYSNGQSGKDEMIITLR